MSTTTSTRMLMALAAGLAAVSSMSTMTLRPSTDAPLPKHFTRRRKAEYPRAPKRLGLGKR